MSLKLNSSGGGSVTLQEPTTSSARTLSLPDVTGTVITTADSGTVTPTMLARPLTLATAQNTTSGTAIDFTGIPSWVRRITIIINNVSTNGTSALLIQIGSGSFETSGYNSCASIGGAGVASASSTAGYLFEASGGGGAGTSRFAAVTLNNVSGNIWVSSHVGSFGTAGVAFIAGGGGKTIGGTLDRVRLTTVNGTDTFDGGSVNIMYE